MLTELQENGILPPLTDEERAVSDSYGWRLRAHRIATERNQWRAAAWFAAFIFATWVIGSTILIAVLAHS